MDKFLFTHIIWVVSFIHIALSSSKLDNPNIGCEKSTLGLTAQHGTSPYQLLISQNLSVAPGDSGVELLLMAPVSAPPFIGFIVEVLFSMGDPAPVGRFNPNNSDSSAQVQNCGGQLDNVMTHKDLSPKRRVKLEWIAPLNGEYTPVVTWFQSGDVYWVNEAATGKSTIKITSSG